ncbi:LacI family DNA-binding transcriptional regulator [Halalkalibaculum sp. DA384]|uniref:LacI family DNA-binding transcriptional regulator n=1 Tax=Halalkalibaculum sp. DA384 TaxID=3373606 RepID=UPI0037553AD4
MSEKKIRLSDIANELGVTASTVSRALQDHPRISDSTKEAVVKKAEELNYQYNNIAAALRKGTSNLLGILVPTADRNFFSSIIRGVEELANDTGYNVVICQSYDSFEKEKKNINALLEAQVDGILASIAMETADYAHYQKVLDSNIPLIFYDRVNPSLHTSSVVVDDYRGAYQVVEHLVDQGCSRIAHFAGEQHINIYQERLRGYKDALKAHDLPVDEQLIIKNKLKLDSGSEAMKQLLSLSNPPDAIFSASDYAAIGAIQVLKEKNIDVPGQIAVAGFSNEQFTSLVDPPLTTIDQQTNKMGKMAAELFFQQMKSKEQEFEPQQKVLEPKLITRASTLKKR